jgi:hypothetical protein
MNVCGHSTATRGPGVAPMSGPPPARPSARPSAIRPLKRSLGRPNPQRSASVGDHEADVGLASHAPGGVPSPTISQSMAAPPPRARMPPNGRRRRPLPAGLSASAPSPLRLSAGSVSPRSRSPLRSAGAAGWASPAPLRPPQQRPPLRRRDRRHRQRVPELHRRDRVHDRRRDRRRQRLHVDLACDLLQDAPFPDPGGRLHSVQLQRHNRVDRLVQPHPPQVPGHGVPAHGVACAFRLSTTRRQFGPIHAQVKKHPLRPRQRRAQFAGVHVKAQRLPPASVQDPGHPAGPAQAPRRARAVRRAACHVEFGLGGLGHREGAGL